MAQMIDLRGVSTDYSAEKNKAATIAEQLLIKPSSADSDDDTSSVVSSDTSAAEVHEIANLEVFKRQTNRSAWFKHLKDDRLKDTTSSEAETLTDESQAHSTTNRIIDKVRDYQQELFERAKQENIVAV